MSKALLILGATGKQGGSTINALLALPNASDFIILAVTRDPSSPSAQKLKGKSSIIKLVQGDYTNIPALFKNARQAAGQPIWGVFSVLLATGKGEEDTGKAIVDEAIKQNVRHFVFSSVDRGGNEVSWTRPTKVVHFWTKHRVELYLRDHAPSANMTWAILRPTAFMDNFAPGFESKVFLTAIRNSLHGKPLQFVAVRDIGYFAAQALSRPDEYNGKAIGLAGSEVTFPQLSDAFKAATGSPAPTTMSFTSKILKMAMSDVAAMLSFFANEGYGVDIPKLKAVYPQLTDFETWLREESAFGKK